MTGLESGLCPLQSFIQEITGISRIHMKMRTGSFVIQFIICLSIEIKFSGIYFWNVRMYQHYNSLPKISHPWLSLLISLQQDEALHGHHFLLPDPGHQQSEIGNIPQSEKWARGGLSASPFPRIHLSRGHIPTGQRSQTGRKGACSLW